MTLGAWPDVSLALARTLAAEARAVVAQGLDPLDERKREKVSGLTLDDAVTEWDAAPSGRRKRAEVTRARAMMRLRKHVLPRLGSRLVTQLTRGDIVATLDAIPGEETQHRCFLALSAVLERLAVAGTVPTNTARPLASRYPAPVHKARAAIVELGPFGALLRAILDYPGQMVTRCALQLLTLTAVRSKELRFARWCEMDLDAALWTIPAARMKVRSNGDHVVPLSPQAIAVLKELRCVTFRESGSLVLPGLRAGRPLSDATLGQALRTLGYSPDVHVPHGFRSSFSTMANRQAAIDGGRRWTPEHIEVALAHGPGDKVASIYNRETWMQQRRDLMTWWGSECDRMREGVPHQK